MYFETKIDRLRQKEAMKVLSRHFNREFKENQRKGGSFDFYTAKRGCVCEHKYRHYLLEDFQRLGGTIWLETRKYDSLMKAARVRTDVPLFVVTLKNGYVVYADVRKIDTGKQGVATREKPRDDYDTDPCYPVPITLFKAAGIARIFHKE